MTAILASDTEREQTVQLLRFHHLEGRLTLDEFEQRAGDAYRSREIGELWVALRGLPVTRPAPVRTGEGVAALALGLVGMGLLVMSLGLLAFLAAPVSASGWAIAGKHPTGVARAGQIVSIVATTLAVLALAGCGALLAAG